MITVGSRNEGFQTHSWNDFPDGAGFIQIDIEPFEIGRNWVPDVGIAGDAGIVLAQLTNAGRQKARITSQEPGRLEALAQAKREFEHEVEIECLATGSPIAAKRVVFETSRVLGKDTILVNENGSQDCWSYCFPYYKVEDGSSCIPVAEQTCMGMGVVGAIAAKIVRPDKKAVCVTGDGAFQMYMKEVPTAVQYKAGCTWVILNNSSFGWIKHEEMSSVGWDTATFQVQPDFAKWAEACGCYGEKVEDPSNIRPALERAFKANCQGTPAILDFIIGPVDMSHFERAI